jgi:hypothetical protein
MVEAQDDLGFRCESIQETANFVLGSIRLPGSKTLTERSIRLIKNDPDSNDYRLELSAFSTYTLPEGISEAQKAIFDVARKVELRKKDLVIDPHLECIMSGFLAICSSKAEAPGVSQFVTEIYSRTSPITSSDSKLPSKLETEEKKVLKITPTQYKPGNLVHSFDSLKDLIERGMDLTDCELIRPTPS